MTYLHKKSILATLTTFALIFGKMIGSLEFELLHRKLELNCHNKLSFILSDASKPAESTIAEILDLIPQGFESSSNIGVSIEIHSKTYGEKIGNGTFPTLTGNIVIDGEVVGKMIVCDYGTGSSRTSSQFTHEKEAFITSIALRVGSYLRSIEKASALQKNQNLYQSFLSASPDVITITDLQGKIQFSSDGALKMFGYEDPALFLDRSMLDFVDLEGHERAKQAIEKMFHDQQARAAEYIGVRADGSRFDIEVNGEFIRDENGNPIQMIFVTRDITERKQTEIELERFRIISAKANYGIAIATLDGKMIYSNDYFANMHGWDVDEVVHKNLEMFHSEEQMARVIETIEMLKNHGEFHAQEVWRVRKDGSKFPSLMNGMLHKVNGVPQFISATALDITEMKEQENVIRRLNSNLEQKIKERTAELASTNEILRKEIEERKQIEKEIKQARLEAERANLAKSEFLSRMSHELRTPLNSILGFAQLLERGELHLNQKKGVSHILRSGKLLLELINEVLDLARIESGKIAFSPEPVKISELLFEMIDIVHPQTISKGITIEVIDSAAIHCFVQSDRQRLKQVLLNILSNAIKYNKHNGKVWIKVERQEPTLEGEIPVRIAIRDTGNGIAPHDIPRLFTPFERIGAERTETEGTGLGLAVVKKMMDLMGGFVGVESTIGIGSTFWIELPETTQWMLDGQVMVDTLHDQTEWKNRKGTIMYVEDNRPNVDLVEEILTMARPGLKLVTTIYGKQAVSMASDYQPHLILLDLNLPDIHGREVLQLLKSNPLTSAIPVVIITADIMQLHSDHYKKLGAYDFLIKPIAIENFIKIIDTVFH